MWGKKERGQAEQARREEDMKEERCGGSENEPSVGGQGLTKINNIATRLMG